MSVTWTKDKLSGAYTSNAMSNYLRKQAIAQMVIAPYVKAETFGKHQGDTLTLVRINQLTELDDYEITDSELVPEQSVTLEKVEVTIKRFARAVPFTDWYRDLGKFDLAY